MPDEKNIGRTNDPAWKVTEIFQSPAGKTLVRLEVGAYAPSEDWPQVGQTLVLKKEG